MSNLQGYVFVTLFCLPISEECCNQPQKLHIFLTAQPVTPLNATKGREEENTGMLITHYLLTKDK
jgi:hypothetical protein